MLKNILAFLLLVSSPALAQIGGQYTLQNCSQVACALPSGTTAPTPSAGDNSTKLATTAFAAPVFEFFFGSGRDGSVTISSGTTTLVRDMFYANLTINSTGILNTNGFRVFVSGTLDISAAGAGAIQSNAPAGVAASGATGGQMTRLYGSSNTTLPQIVVANGKGGTGNSTTGTNGILNPSSIPCTYSVGLAGTGGAGGNSSNVGAAGIAAQSIYVGSYALFDPIPFYFTPFGGGVVTSSIISQSLIGGPGGQGGGDGTNPGGGGASATNGGGMIEIHAATISRGTNSNVGIIQATGGAGALGGNGTGGNAGGGGGGGGGTGGFVFIVAETLTGSTIVNGITVNGGPGGAGGNGVGTGIGGTGGQGGGPGGAVLHVIGASPSFNTVSGSKAGAVPVTATTATGTSGTAGVILGMNL